MPNLLLPYQELPIVANLIIAHFQAARASKRWWAQGSWGVAWWCQPPSRAPPPPAWWSPSSTPPPWVVTDTNKFNGKHELQSTKVDSLTNLPSIWSKTCYRKMAHLIDCMSPCVIQYISPTLDFSWLIIVKNLFLLFLAGPVEPVKEKKKQFPCYYCDKKFPKIKLLQEHRLNHVVGMGQFPCRLVWPQLEK